jgi:hypothetical protein
MSGDGKTHTLTYFYPGKYAPETGFPTDAQFLKGDYMYFASGVYYFKDVGYQPIKEAQGLDKTLVGAWGGASSDTQFAKPGGTCNDKLTDAAARTACSSCLPADAGQGVTFILGGKSLFDIHAGITELNRRVAGDQEATCAGGKQKCGGVTIFAWASDPLATDRNGQRIITGDYSPFNPGLTLDRCNCAFVTDNGGEQIIFHGLTYSPYSPVDVYSNAGGANGVDYSPFYGGVVASEIVARVDKNSLSSSQFAGGFGPNDAPSPRTIRIEAETAQGRGGSTPVKATAIITVDPYVPNTTKVLSWRNQGP